MNKKFNKYLLDVKKPYEFKVKVAGECPDDCIDRIKSALESYEVLTCSKKLSVPAQEVPYDFPTLRNIEVTVFDISLKYPATGEQIRADLAAAGNIPGSHIVVRTLFDDECVVTAKQPLLTSEYEPEDIQHLVGEKRFSDLLKELEKEPKKHTQYTGVNDQILAKNCPSESPAKVDKPGPAKSVLGSKPWRKINGF